MRIFVIFGSVMWESKYIIKAKKLAVTLTLQSVSSCQFLESAFNIRMNVSYYVVLK
jgi:hypothetical protein